jgi:acetoacetate decarboxylase
MIIETPTNIPIHSPLYPSSLVYTAENCRSLVITCNASEDKLGRFLQGTPFTLRAPFVVLEGGVFKECTAGDFCFSGVLIPVTYRGINGAYYAFSYVDTDVSLALGREPFGYPKKLANIEVDEQDRQIGIKTSRQGRCILELNGQMMTNSALAEPVVTTYPHLLLQIIPDVDGLRPIVKRIVSRDTHSRSELVSELSVRAQVHIDPGTGEELEALGIQSVCEARFVRTRFRSAPGTVVQDLLSGAADNLE